MDACKCIVPLRHGDTLNSRRAASPLVWLVEREERWEAPDHPEGFLPLNWDGTEQKRIVTCMVPKTKANVRVPDGTRRQSFRQKFRNFGCKALLSKRMVSINFVADIKVLNFSTIGKPG
ncbi:uncharacterized protein TNCV_3822631 [Trichonephila clavipes]|nr:uncharacterized protein TNCV_3822631 [Trichonephila clavipes]